MIRNRVETVADKDAMFPVGSGRTKKGVFVGLTAAMACPVLIKSARI